jgi:hypothetical protein
MEVQANVDRSSDDIEWDDEDTLIRVQLVNRGIRTWAKDNGTEWVELASPHQDFTIQTGTTSFGLDDEFEFLDGVFDSQGYSLEVKGARQATRPGQYFYLTGNKSDGYQLNLGWTPNDKDNLVGTTIRVLSYREPVELKRPTDIPEMSDPGYLVAYVTAELMIDDDTTQYTKYSNDAAIRLANMRQLNSRLSQGQHESALDDSDLVVGGDC